MKNRKKFNKNIYIILGVIFFVIAILIFLNKQNFIDTAFFKSAKDVTEKVKQVIVSPFVNLTNKFSKLNDIDSILEENKKLVIENQELNILNAKSEILEEELNELKDAISLNRVYANYDIETASVVSRNVDYWFNNITIDKGESSGIRVGDAVVTINGLIGKVISTSRGSATIKLITAKNSDMKISVLVSGSGNYHHGTIVNYNDGLLEVSGITNYDGVNVNSRVLTSGMGNFPKGILVGYVKEVKEDSYGTSKILYVETKQDMNDLRYVTVLKEKK